MRTLFLTLITCLFVLPAYAKYSGGRGVPDDPYQIATAEDLMLLGETPEDYDKHFILTADIDLDPNLPGRKVFDKAVIAPDTDPTKDYYQGPPFSGVFDGNTRKILHLTIKGVSYLGLFGQLGSVQSPIGEVGDLGVVDVNIVGSGNSIGALVALNYGTVTQCYSTGAVVSTGDVSVGDLVGGLVGSNHGHITYCYSTSAVRGVWDVGGVVGCNWDGNVTHSYSSGAVSGVGAVGGLVGGNYDGTVILCDASGTVIGSGGGVGGLVGDNRGDVTECHSTGAVSGSARNGGIGGLVGSNIGGTVTYSYSTGSASGEYSVGGLVGSIYGGGIRNCHSMASASGRNSVGGLVGYNDERGTVVYSYSTGAASGEHDAAGLVGYNDGTVTQCCTSGAATGNDRVGGLAGTNGGTITNSYATGSITGASSIGGLVGTNGYYRSYMLGGEWLLGTISKCYSTSVVSGTGEYVGGLVGLNTMAESVEGIVVDCFWNMEISGQTRSDGGTGKTTAEMQTASTFLEAGWDFMGETGNGTENIWGILEGKDYPRLWWENRVPGPTTWEGSGTPDDPYQIATPGDLMLLGDSPEDYDKHFILTADIDLDPKHAGRAVFYEAVIAPDTDPNDEWGEFQGTVFTGVFDGNGHTISHLTIVGDSHLGLFGGLYGEVKNLSVVDVEIISSGSHVGALVGENYGTVHQSYSTGAVSGNGNFVGGLIGEGWGCLTDSCSSATVVGKEGVGGLVGCNYKGTVTHCYSTAAVTGTSFVGGLAGINLGTVNQCYSTGLTRGDRLFGGLLGTGSSSAVTASFWDMQTSGQTSSAGGTGKTTAEMQTESTFTDAGWDFVGETTNGTQDIWWIDEGKDYPKLWWELIPEN